MLPSSLARSWPVLGLLAALAAGCQSSTASSDEGTSRADGAAAEVSTRTDALVSYTAPCGPLACDRLASTPIGCPSGSQPTAHCFPNAQGTCVVDMTCSSGGGTPPTDGSDGGAAGPGAPSFAPCAPSACAPEPPPITCADGTSPTQSCGNEHQLGCRWITTCTPPPSTVPCNDDAACGPPPTIAHVCPEGQTMSAACMKHGSACGWQYDCK